MDGAEGDVEHQRVEARNERGAGNDPQARPRSGGDSVIMRDHQSSYVANI